MTKLPRAQPRPLDLFSNLSPKPCAACDVRALGLCAGLADAELGQVSSIARLKSYPAGTPIFHEHSPAELRFNIVQGHVKLYKLLSDGRRQIIGFLGRGDFLGLGSEEDYTYSAEAVDDVQLCAFRRPDLHNLINRYPKLEHRLLSMASSSLEAAQDQMVLLGRKTACERLASFLLSLSRAQARRGDDPKTVSVPMTRADIADYLGLTTETVSRTFTRLKQERAIRMLDSSRIELRDLREVESLASG